VDQLHHADDGLDEDARGEVLACALFAFARSLFEQALERRAFDIDVHGGPVFLVDHRNDAFEVDRVIKARSSLGEDVGQQAAGFAQLSQDVRVVIGQSGADLSLRLAQSWPLGPRRSARRPFSKRAGT